MTTTRTTKVTATFAPQTTFSSGNYPQGLEVGDFNNDSKIDIVTGNGNSIGNQSYVVVLLGNGTGSFSEQKIFKFASFSSANGISKGDFNADGNIDITVGTNGLEFPVLLGDGNGNFSKPIPLVGSNYSTIQVGDFNNDGKSDIVAANMYNYNVSIFLANSSNEFDVKKNFDIESSPASVNVGDLNNDKKLDIVTANSSNDSISVLLGNGDGSFGKQTTFSTGVNPGFIEISDFNGDNKPDIVTTNANYRAVPDGDNVSILLGDGNGSFTKQIVFSAGNKPTSVATGDFNGDGLSDVSVTNLSDDNVSVLLGDGTGGFFNKTNFSVGNNPNFIKVSDFNNDSKLDIVTANQYDDTISILLNTTGINSISTGDITFSGNPQQNQTFSAINNLADADGLGTISYQWLSNGVVITNATQSNYTPTQTEVGKTLSIMASYTDGHGNLETVTSSIDVAVTNSNDLPTGNVTILGTPTQGQVLTAANSLSDVDGLGAISYQWQIDGKVISGATANTYTLTQAEVGKAISVKASYTDLFGASESVASSGTLVVNINDLPTGEVTISGIPTQGQTLTANNALVDLDGLGKVSYQWQSNGKVISGATANTYVLTQDEVGKTISVKANYTDLFGTVESVVSSATVAVANINDLPTGSVTVVGKPTQGQILSLTNSIADLDGLGKLSYQWLSDGTAISGATKDAFTLTQSEVGKVISAKVSYIDGQGTAENLTSSATTKVTNINDLPTGLVTISGNPTQGQVLTAENTLIDADGLGTLSYQWFANGKVIKDGTDYTYTPTQTEIGKALSVKVNYVDGQGTKESLTSSDTALVTNSNHLPTGNIVIKGAAKVEQVLSLTSTLEDADGLGDFSYQWLSNGKEIKNATQDTYKLLKSDIGSKISVNVSYTDGEGTDELVTSVATAKVVTNISAKPSKGNDQLVGTAKNDKLSSLAGDDTLIGGQGADTLTGGKGADTFVFNNESESWITSTTRDTITDFTSGIDKIDLSAIDTNAKISGNQAFKFIGSNAFSKTDASGQLRFDATSHILYGSTNADSKPEFSIQLNGVNSLVADDFVL